MSLLEIVLLICGGIIFVLSFIVPVSKQEVSGETKDAAKEEIKRLVTEEMEGVKSHVDDAVDEAVEYAMEKTERSLERLSNEKIMAVSDYSDTVMQEIHKNHEEVMFLYDMLNDKHTNLKNTVAQVNKTVKTVEEKTKEAEAAVSSIKELNVPAAQEGQERSLTDIVYVDTKEKPKTVEKAKPKPQPKTQTKPQTEQQPKTQDMDEPQPKADDDAKVSEKKNRNDEILELHKQGKSNVAIARQLGLGVGEVKLVIDLYKA
jgi:hypothetical protein